MYVDIYVMYIWGNVRFSASSQDQPLQNIEALYNPRLIKLPESIGVLAALFRHWIIRWWPSCGTIRRVGDGFWYLQFSGVLNHHHHHHHQHHHHHHHDHHHHHPRGNQATHQVIMVQFNLQIPPRIWFGETCPINISPSISNPRWVPVPRKLTS